VIQLRCLSGGVLFGVIGWFAGMDSRDAFCLINGLKMLKPASLPSPPYAEFIYIP